MTNGAGSEERFGKTILVGGITAISGMLLMVVGTVIAEIFLPGGLYAANISPLLKSIIWWGAVSVMATTIAGVLLMYGTILVRAGDGVTSPHTPEESQPKQHFLGMPTQKK